MLTLFTCPKPFRGPIGVIQRNAVRSWLRFCAPERILLAGDEEGLADAARALGVRHLPGVERNACGTPLVNSVFALAEREAGGGLLAYVNTDILLLADFAAAVARMPRRRFLMVGRRLDVEWAGSLATDEPGWDDRFLAEWLPRAVPHAHTGIDYFVFPRGLWAQIPPFALGRTAWDNWLIYAARAVGAMVVDASPCVHAFHQNHDYQHGGGAAAVWDGPEAQRNLDLAGGETRVFTLRDATHVLTSRGCRRLVDAECLEVRLRRQAVLASGDRLGARIRRTLLGTLAKRRPWRPDALRRRLIALLAR
jgi:hypothetical protein